MLMIRLQRIGRRNDAAYRIAVLEKARAARAGRVVEALGSYNPKTKAFTLDETRAKEWISHGAEPTDTLKNLFITKGVMTGKKVDVFPASARKKAKETAAKAEADAAAAKKAAEEAAAAAEKTKNDELVTQSTEGQGGTSVEGGAVGPEAPAADTSSPSEAAPEAAPAEAAPEEPAA